MLKKVIVGLFCFIILAVSGIGAYVYMLDWNKHKSLLSQRFAQITGLNASIEGNLRVEYFPTPKFTAGKVSFWKGKDKRNPLVEIDEVIANVELMPLLDNKFIITSMILTKPTFNIRVSEKGEMNWSNVGGKGKNKVGNVEVSFKDVKLNNSTISYINAQNNEEFELPNISASVSASSLKGPYKADGKLLYNKNEIKFAGNVTNNNGIKLNFNISNNASNTKATIEGTLGEKADGLITFETKNFEKIANIIWGDNTVSSTYNENLYFSFKYNKTPEALKLENFTAKYGNNTVGTGSVDIQNTDNQRVVDAVFKMNKIDLNIFQNIGIDYVNAFKSKKDMSNLSLDKHDIKLNINADTAFYNEAESQNLILALELKDTLFNVSRLGITMPGNTEVKTSGSVDLSTLKFQFKNALKSDDFRVFASIFGVDVTKLAAEENKKTIFKNVVTNFDLFGDLEQIKISLSDTIIDSTAIKGNIGFAKNNENNIALADLELSKIIFDKYININGTFKDKSLKEKFTHQMNMLPWSKDLALDASIYVGSSVYNGIPLEGLKLVFSSHLDNLKVTDLTANNIAGTYVNLNLDAENIRTEPNFKELTYNVKSNDLPLFASTVGIDLGTKKLFNRKIFASQGVLAGNFNDFNLSSVQKFDDVEFSYTGKVKNDNKVFVDGDIELKSDNFVNLLADYGFSYTPDIPLTSFTISSKLTGSNDLFELVNINSYLGANNIAGNLSVDNTENKPKIKGDFVVDKIELNRWISIDDRIISNEISHNESFVSKPLFIDDKIDYSSLEKVDFDLTTNIKHLVFNNKNFSNTSLDMKLINGIFNVSKLDTRYGENEIYLDFILDSQKIPSISGNYNLKNIKLPDIGGTTYMIKNGILDISGNFTSLAESKKEFFSNLDSKGEFKLNNSSIKGFDFDIIKFEFEQSDSINGFEDKILNSLKTGISSFPLIKGGFNITRGVIVSDNIEFSSPVVNINTKFNLNMNDWLFYTTFDAIFHNASFSDILKFKMTGSMNNPSISVDLTETLERISSVEQMSKNILKQEQQKKLDELNNKIRNVEKNINSTLTSISRIHYDVARFKPVSSNADIAKTYNNNIELLQQTENAIKDIRAEVLNAKDIEALVNLNNRFLAEDAKLKFISKTLEDNYIIDGKYIFDDIFNKIAWVYNVIQNNSSYYKNITDVYMNQVEFSKSSEEPISKEVEKSLIESVRSVNSISDKASELHNKFRDNYLSMIDTNKVADMKENNDIAKEALNTMLTYAKQYNNDMVVSIDKFREALDIQNRDYNEYMINVPNTVNEIDITKPTSPSNSKSENSEVENTEPLSDDEIGGAEESVLDEASNEDNIKKDDPALNINMDINKGLNGLLNKFNSDNLDKKKEELISKVSFGGLSNIIAQNKPVKEETVKIATVNVEEPNLDTAKEDISNVKEVSAVEPSTETYKTEIIEVAETIINEPVTDVSDSDTNQPVKTVIKKKPSFSDMIKSSINIALSKIKSMEDTIIKNSIEEKKQLSDAENKKENTVNVATADNSLKVNPVIALNIGKENIAPSDNSSFENITIKKNDTKFKRNDVANVVKSLNKSYDIGNIGNTNSADNNSTLVASLSIYDIDSDTKGLLSNSKIKNDTLVIANNKYLFPNEGNVTKSGVIKKSMYKNDNHQINTIKKNKYLFAQNDNIKVKSGEIGKIAFLTVK